MMILENRDLDIHCVDIVAIYRLITSKINRIDRFVMGFAMLDLHCCPITGFGLEREDVPVDWILEVFITNLLQIVHVQASSDAKLFRCVTLITFEVQINGNMGDSGLLHELNVHKMGNRSIRSKIKFKPKLTARMSQYSRL